MYRYLLKPILFRISPEFAHHLAFYSLKYVQKFPTVGTILRKLFSFEHPDLEREVFGLKFKNPVGLAAGFDKDAKAVDELSVFGFGFIEVGTVTPRPQSGNLKPRLFRLKKDEAIINRMGFNNQGVEAAVRRLKNRKSNVIVGGNIGKNKITSNEDAIKDYLICYEKLYPYVDYFVVNVSSPNTPGLRELQDKEPLKKLLEAVLAKNKAQKKPRPVLLKIAPDLTNEQLDDVIDIVHEIKLDGIIATNTTISREGLKESKSKVEEIGAGGLSGKPLTKRSTEVIKYIRSKSDVTIIGVGGIHTAEDALEKLNAGASLVQLYTGFIYEGPELIKKINKAIISAKQAE